MARKTWMQRTCEVLERDEALCGLVRTIRGPECYDRSGGARLVAPDRIKELIDLPAGYDDAVVSALCSRQAKRENPGEFGDYVGSVTFAYPVEGQRTHIFLMDCCPTRDMALERLRRIVEQVYPASRGGVDHLDATKR